MPTISYYQKKKKKVCWSVSKMLTKASFARGSGELKTFMFCRYHNDVLGLSLCQAL